MSSALTRQLPRFDTDVPTSSVSLAHATQRDFSTDQPVESIQDVAGLAATIPDEVDEVRVPADAETEEQVVPTLQDQAPHQPQFELATEALLAAISQVEANAQQQLTTQMREMAQQLFPILGQAFLADELAHHIVKLVPPTLSSATIIAAPDLAASLQARLESAEETHTDIKVVHGDEMAPMQVKLSWQSGGFDYNFDDMLAACIAQAESRQLISKG